MKVLSGKNTLSYYDMMVNFVEKFGWPFYLVISVYISLYFVALPDDLSKSLHYLILIVATCYISKSLNQLITSINEKLKTDHFDKKKLDPSVIDVSAKITKVLIWTIAVIIIIQNSGYNVSGLVAGLSISGVIVAFALQSILGDIFASVSIYIDKPFNIGDFIVIGEDSGVVKQIGMKSTRIEALSGEELIIPTKDLTQNKIHNYKKMKKRRVLFNINVVYDTSSNQLKKIPEIIKNIIIKIDNTDFQRVHFIEFGDSSLKFEIVYYINTNDYDIYMDIRQKINLAIKEQFEKNKIEMAKAILASLSLAP
ncbi:hypothetical protein A2272_00660 [Candidatus Peregrinibacteria bacterium RIFOXYA12_FULL_33_12]|nr:MAG: hypothetical protein A2272_00660 [Candidatus Peregrinibacteria bacterium RIFOXYA12_FULL_33_12]OGJ44796.1 MAG: hypothetical protein A2263_06180 [Candidatus Peregrinibacteria bacterium RIFOXYA2_FULL_33_21]OGJ50482.1 MAG: hypothetical protein A2307_02805 [Candidatus Peregrinibacteria bacterium RIFOXYB2_FULL_33_20]